MVQQILIALLLLAVQVIVAIALSAGALYTGINLLDRLTPGIDEWKQIKKGNIAVGIFYAVVMVSLVMVVSPRIVDFISYISLPISLPWLLFTLINYLLALAAGTLLIFLTIHIIDRLTHDLDEMEELEKGNVAVSLIMSAVLISVVLVSIYPIGYAFNAILYLESLI